jgi:inosine/xanthosine triphosphatase
VRVRLGSESRAKVEAVRRGLGTLFGEVCVDPVTVESGVPEQPLGFDEIVAGARNRARAAYDDGGCDLGVGIEDGLVPVPGARTGWVNIGCCVLYDGREEHVGFSAGFEYPNACVESALGPERVPVGTSFDSVYRAPEGFGDPGPGAGNIGRLTGGAVTRVEYGAQAVTCAAVRLLHPSLYRDGS